MNKNPVETPEEKTLIDELKSITPSEEMWALALLLEEDPEIEEIELTPLDADSTWE